MKKILSLALVAGCLTFGAASFAQSDMDTATTEMGSDNMEAQTQVQEPVRDERPAMDMDMEDAAVIEDKTFHQILKEKFIEGDPLYMTPVLICLILGLAIAIERIITLNMSTTNTRKLISRVEDALNTGGVAAAEEVVVNTRGPVASIFAQGLTRMSEGVDMVEKSIVAYGSVEMGKLERGLVWISLFIALAPMLGFMGTVIGMIGAFDSIEAAGDISPSLVAGGIKVALLTTVAGLVVAIILQLFYNYCVSKIDSIVNSMEDATISMVDLLVRHKLTGHETVVVKNVK